LEELFLQTYLPLVVLLLLALFLAPPSLLKASIFNQLNALWLLVGLVVLFLFYLSSWNGIDQEKLLTLFFWMAGGWVIIGVARLVARYYPLRRERVWTQPAFDVADGDQSRVVQNQSAQNQPSALDDLTAIRFLAITATVLIAIIFVARYFRDTRIVVIVCYIAAILTSLRAATNGLAKQWAGPRNVQMILLRVWSLLLFLVLIWPFILHLAFRFHPFS
jgi:hypothetical protein